jgi:hypothetical protein
MHCFAHIEQNDEERDAKTSSEAAPESVQNELVKHDLNDAIFTADEVIATQPGCYKIQKLVS